MREFKFVYLISYGLLFLAFLYIITNSKKTKDKAYLMFCFYLIIVGLIDAIAGTFAFFKKYNLFLTHYYFVAEFITLSLFFRELVTFKQRKLVNILIVSVSFVLLSLFTLSVFGYYNLKPFDPLQVIICALPLLIFSMIHLYNSMSTSLKFIYVAVGVLFYKTISVLIFMLLNFANMNDYFDGFSGLLWDLNRVCLIIYFVLILFEWFKNYRVKKIN